MNTCVIEKLVKDYVAEYPDYHKTETNWQEPLIAYAQADDPQFAKLKQAVGPGHAMPHDLLADAETVVAYFIPFAKEIIKSNITGREASRAWALAYIQTNQLIKDLNQHIYKCLNDSGYTCSRIPPTHNFDKVKLISDWSHRHVAIIAGLGTLGLNNMLITEKGCGGRIGTLVTNLKIPPTTRREGENGLYKSTGTCMRCVKRCVNQALEETGFDRHRCYEMCLLNEDLHSDLGKTDVCGKCLVGVPCAMSNPAQKLSGQYNQ